MTPGRLTPSRRASAVLLALLLTACGTDGSSGDADAPQARESSRSPSPAASSQEAGPSPEETAGGFEPLQPPGGFTRLDGLVDLSSLPSRGDTFDAWRDVVPRIQDVEIPTTTDGTEQGALWLAPQGDEPRPLIVALHSWSTRYLQYFSTPFARWADQEGWAMVAPDFRGAFRTPEATGSDAAVQDVVDAVDWAIEQGGVDEQRVFVAGFSGGGMMSLLMAGRHPERFAGAVSWVPVYDLVDWYAYNVEVSGRNRYAREIEASCGGNPRRDPQARARCEKRSPVAHLDAARAAGLPVYLGHGLHDRTVLPSQAVRAFDQLADEEDRLGEQVRRAARSNGLPEQVPGRPAESFFAEQDPEVLLSRRSGPVTLVLFDGRHNMVIHPGLAWMAALAQREQ